MKAMLFAAGLGTRLRPLTLTTPKSMIDVAGKPLIAYGLEALKKAGVQDVMINTHHLADPIKAYVGDGSRWNLHCWYSHEPILLGTGGGLLKVRSFFENEQKFWVVNSDTLLDMDLGEVSTAMTLVTHTAQPPQFGGVWINPQQKRVLSFFDALPAPAQEVDFCGVSLLAPSIFAPLAAASTRNPAPCLIREGLAPLLQGGQAIHAYAYSGYFNDVGTPERLEEARRHLR